MKVLRFTVPSFLLAVSFLAGIFLFSGCLEEHGFGEDGLTSSIEQTARDEPHPLPETGILERTRLKGGYLFGEEDVSFLELSDDLPGWFEQAAERGVNVVSFSPFTLEGITLIDSPTLKSAGFKPDPEIGYIFPDILREAGKYNMTVIVMLEGIAHINDNFMPSSEDIRDEKLTPSAVQQLVSEIAEEGLKQGVEVAVDEEAFNDAYINAISQASAKNEIPYLHFFEDLECRADGFITEDYSYYPLDARRNSEDQEYLRQLLRLGSYYGQLGNLNAMFGVAEGCGVPGYVLTAGGWGLGPRTHQNIALMRAVQFNPEMFMFVVGEDDSGPIFEEEVHYVENYDFEKQLLPLLEEFARKPGEDRPLANLIIVKVQGSEDLEDFYLNAELSSMSAITSAMLAAGYDLVVTRAPYPGASLYYVFSPGLIFEEGADLSPELAALADGQAPVFYQVAGALPEASNWNKVTEKLGIRGRYQVLVNEDDTYFFNPIPESVSYDFPTGRADVKYGGYSFEVYDPSVVGMYSAGHYLHYINPSDVEAEVLLVGNTSKDEDGRFDDPTALILQRNNVYFVNGGYLHHAVSAILANIIAGEPVYNAPSYGYFTNGEERAVFFAPYDVEIDLRVFGGNRLAEFDENGKRIPPKATLQGDRLHGRVERFHLLVVN